MAQAQRIYSIVRPSRCHNCDTLLAVGQLTKLNNADDDKEVLCMNCAGLSQYVVVPSGNAKVTNLVKKYSKGVFPIVRWSELWKTYERVGLLVEQEAARQVEKELGMKLTGD